MRLTQTRNANRRGFTLVEVLVAAGLSMLIMTMVTYAFSKAMDSLSQLKSLGEMQQRLRSVETALRTDLNADHFEGGYMGGNRVRDQRLDLLNMNVIKPPLTFFTNDTAPWRPPV